MQKKHQDLLDMLLDIVKTKYANDISIMMIYGSCANGTSNETSDLDMIFIPKTKRGRHFSKTFILEGIGYDLWGANWKTLKKFANFDDMKVSVVADSQLVYYASEADKQKYEALVNKAKTIAGGPLTRNLRRKAKMRLNKAKQYCDDFDEMGLVAAGGILMEVCNVVCLLNHTYLRFGSKRVIEELLALDRLPADFMSKFRSVIEQTGEAKERCAALIDLTERFLHGKNRKIPSAKNRIASWKKKTKKTSAASDFSGLYEEISSHWNKIRASCASGDVMYAFFSAASLQQTLDSVQKSLGVMVPEICFIDKFDARNLQAIALAANNAEVAFVNLLQSKGVSITRYDTLAQLRQSFVGGFP